MTMICKTLPIKVMIEQPTQTPQKNWGELRCSGRWRSSWFSWARVIYCL